MFKKNTTLHYFADMPKKVAAIGCSHLEADLCTSCTCCRSETSRRNLPGGSVWLHWGWDAWVAALPNPKGSCWPFTIWHQPINSPSPSIKHFINHDSKHLSPSCVLLQFKLCKQKTVPSVRIVNKHIWRLSHRNAEEKHATDADKNLNSWLNQTPKPSTDKSRNPKREVRCPSILAGSCCKTFVWKSQPSKV